MAQERGTFTVVNTHIYGNRNIFPTDLEFYAAESAIDEEISRLFEDDSFLFGSISIYENCAHNLPTAAHFRRSQHHRFGGNDGARKGNGHGRGRSGAGIR